VTIDTAQFRYAPGRALTEYPTHWRILNNAQARVADSLTRLSELQELLWADDRRHADTQVFSAPVERRAEVTADRAPHQA
jgi:hypothetical protein